MLPNMKKNEDGSLTLYLQKDSPGTNKEANWLPAPNDTIYLVMRLYWPKTEAPSILPAGRHVAAARGRCRAIDCDSARSRRPEQAMAFQALGSIFCANLG